MPTQLELAYQRGAWSIIKCECCLVVAVAWEVVVHVHLLASLQSNNNAA